MALNSAEIARRFAAPARDDERHALKARLSAAAGELAALVHDLVPGSREETLAVTAIEDAVQWAHAGIDRRHTPRGRTTAPQPQEPHTPAHGSARSLAAAVPHLPEGT